MDLLDEYYADIAKYEDAYELSELEQLEIIYNDRYAEQMTNLIFDK